MMQIAWFYYKEDSILDKSLVRGVNYTLLVLLAIGPLLNQEFKGIILSYFNLLVIIVGAAIITGFCVNKVESNTTFYEWDYTERKKKSRFLRTYLEICCMFSLCLMLSLCMAYNTMFDDRIPIGLKIIVFLPIMIISFNLVNIPTLFYSAFEKDLKQAYKIQKRPDNWQDDGREIKPDDEIEEIMRRDWGI